MRVKKVVGSTATYYVGNWYEVTNGVVTKDYYVGARRVAMKQGSNVTYLHGDHLGSTSVTSGAAASTQTYFAYGGVRSGTLPTDYTFTGQKRDNEAGLHYYGARYYDSALGRFTQPDSIVSHVFNPQDLNRYAYARNNPLKYTDPTGHYLPCDDTCGKPGTWSFDTDSSVEDGRIDPPASTVDNPGPSSWPNDGGNGDSSDHSSDNQAAPNQNEPCTSVSGCIGANPTPPCNSPSGCIGPQTSSGKPEFGEYVPDVLMISIGPLGGLGNVFQVQTLDVLIQLETGEFYFTHTFATPYADDFVSPQVGASVMGGAMWNVESALDYQGTFESKGISTPGWGAEHLQSPGGRAWGLLVGRGFTIPQLGGIYAIHTYSDIFGIWKP